MAPLTEKNNNAIVGSKDTKDTKAKKRKSDASDDKPSKKTKGNDDLADYDVSEIDLPGEDKGNVPVYDTCSDIRTKINAFKRNAPKKLASNAAFVREISKCTPDNVSTRNLTTFMKKSGPSGGGDSPAFYASYVYLEKLRVKQGKPKSKKRQEMEEHHGKQGMKLADPLGGHLFLHVTETPHVDKYGKFSIVKMR